MFWLLFVNLLPRLYACMYTLIASLFMFCRVGCSPFCKSHYYHLKNLENEANDLYEQYCDEPNDQRREMLEARQRTKLEEYREERNRII